MLQPLLFHINQFNGTIIKTKPLTPLHLRLFQLYKHRFGTPQHLLFYTQNHMKGFVPSSNYDKSQQY